MRLKYLTYLLLLGAITSCSRQEETPFRGDPAPTALCLTTFSGNVQNYSVSIFRKEQGQFLFQNTLSAGWSADGKLSVQLPVGDYQFVFAHNYGTQTQILPAPTMDVTSFGQLRFTTNAQAGTSPLQISPSDELFLQDQKADSIYKLTQASTIKCQLTRAVAQPLLYIKRGYASGDNKFQALPYPDGKNILQDIEKIRLDIQGIGQAVDALSTPYGTGNLSIEMNAADRDSITSEGFAYFEGPFVFPPEAGQETSIKVTLQPTANSLHSSLSMTVNRILKRNHRLVIIAWINSDWNAVGITTDLTPIDQTTPGEDGIWDDVVTFN